MDIIEKSPTEAKWSEALQNMLTAMDILDESGAPGDIAPHLDMAICRLEDALGCDPAENSIQQLHVVIEEALANVPQDLTKTDTPLWPSQRDTAKPSIGDRPILFR